MIVDDFFLKKDRMLNIDNSLNSLCSSCHMIYMSVNIHIYIYMYLWCIHGKCTSSAQLLKSFVSFSDGGGDEKTEMEY